jgi:hypothetical protein
MNRRSRWNRWNHPWNLQLVGQLCATPPDEQKQQKFSANMFWYHFWYLQLVGKLCARETTRKDEKKKTPV